MSNPPFIAPVPPVTPVAREYKVTPEAQQRALDARRSALEAERAALKRLAAHFPVLGAEADPLARLMSARLAPGPATLLLAAAQAGADEVRLRRLKEALARLLKQAYGEVH